MTTAQRAEEVRLTVEQALSAVPDPCMLAAGSPASIVDLGLVDEVSLDGTTVKVTITLTEPGCPFTHHIIADITDAAEAIEGIEHVEVEPRWAPLWTEDRLLPEGRRQLAAARKRMRQEAS
jgi:ring-1,2-phenylacetyl-CoA epoxidase subunit PaaD